MAGLGVNIWTTSPDDFPFVGRFPLPFFGGVIGPPDAPSGMVQFYTGSGRYVTVIKNGDMDRGGTVGGWKSVDRGGQPEAHYHDGATPPATLSIPFMLDSAAMGGIDVSKAVDVLYGMGLALGRQEDPPAVWINGDILPRDYGIPWKMDDLSITETLYFPRRPGVLRRVSGTVELSRLRKVGEVEDVTVRRSRTGRNRRRQRVIRAKRNDTLRVIAVRELGSVGGWKKLREWNKKLARLDPDKPLRAGTRVVIK